MELNQAVRRVIGRHLLLVLLATGLGLGAGAFLSSNATPMYSAETRLVLDTPDPSGLAEAQTIADTARAIVTSPSEVRVALSSAGVQRDVQSVANNDVAVRALGSSGILQLTVTDPNARAAAVVANRLSDDLIRTRLAVSQGNYEQLRASLEAKVANLTKALQKTTRNVKGSLHVDPGALARQSILQHELGVAETSLSNLDAVQAQRPKPEIIDRAEAPTAPDASRSLRVIVIAGLAGALLGIGLAAMVETFRPTLVGARAISEELGAPPIGELPRSGALPDALAAKGRLAAISVEAKYVQLVAADLSRDLRGLAEAMQRALSHALGEASTARITPKPPTFRSFSASPTRSAEAHATAMLAVLPSSIAKSDLEPLQSLRSIAGYALIGFITYPPVRWFRRRDPFRAFALPPEDSESAAGAAQDGAAQDAVAQVARDAPAQVAPEQVAPARLAKDRQDAVAQAEAAQAGADDSNGRSRPATGAKEGSPNGDDGVSASRSLARVSDVSPYEPRHGSGSENGTTTSGSQRPATTTGSPDADAAPRASETPPATTNGSTADRGSSERQPAAGHPMAGKGKR